MRIHILGWQRSDWVDEVRERLVALSKRFRSLLGSWDAEDLVQEVVLDIVSESLRRSSSLRDVLDKGDKHLAAWALAYARSKAMMRKRRERKALRPPVPREASDWPPWGGANAAIAGRVSHALSRVLGERDSLEVLRRRSAHRVSSENDVAEVWIADLLARCGLALRSVPLQSIDGLLLVADKKQPCILVSDILPVRKKHLVILHEFAHFVLHRNLLDDSKALLVDEKGVEPQNDARCLREIEADLFALCVLKFVDRAALGKNLPSICGAPLECRRQSASFPASSGIAPA